MPFQNLSTISIKQAAADSRSLAQAGFVSIMWHKAAGFSSEQQNPSKSCWLFSKEERLETSLKFKRFGQYGKLKTKKCKCIHFLTSSMKPRYFLSLARFSTLTEAGEGVWGTKVIDTTEHPRGPFLNVSPRNHVMSVCKCIPLECINVGDWTPPTWDLWSHHKLCHERHGLKIFNRNYFYYYLHEERHLCDPPTLTKQR